jgi:hypothetical protein
MAAGLFVAALREAFEESGVLLATRAGQPLEPATRQQALAAVRAGTPFATLLAQHGWLDTHALAPWSRWITPRRPAMMNRRFDTRFFLAAVPDAQEAQQDDHEVTEARWLTRARRWPSTARAASTWRRRRSSACCTCRPMAAWPPPWPTPARARRRWWSRTPCSTAPSA